MTPVRQQILLCQSEVDEADFVERGFVRREFLCVTDQHIVQLKVVVDVASVVDSLESV